MQNKRYLIEHRVLPFFGGIPPTLWTYGYLYPTTSDEAVKKMDDLMR